eukprot:gene4056-4303_t
MVLSHTLGSCALSEATTLEETLPAARDVGPASPQLELAPTPSGIAVMAPAGSYVDRGIGKLCPKGTYIDALNNQTACTACADGVSTPGEGSTSVNACDRARPGYKYTGPNTAEQCEVNTYSDAENPDNSCTPCPFGWLTRDEGSDGVPDCLAPPGWEQTGSTANISECPTNYYKEGWNRNRCVSCGVNLVTNDTGAVSRDACLVPPGYGLTQLSPTLSASPCIANSYGDDQFRVATASARCTPCPANMFTDERWGVTAPANGYTDQVACKVDAGWGLTEAGAVEACQAGFYNPGRNRQPCTKCPNGYTTLNGSAVNITDCVIRPGWFFDTDRSLPAPCERGTYSTGGSATVRQPGNCTVCPTGYSTQVQESDQASDCNVCDAGYGSATPGGSTCELCPVNTFSTGGLAVGESCTPCAAGTVASRGSIDVSQCYAEFDDIARDYFPLTDAAQFAAQPGGTDCQAICRGNTSCVQIRLTAAGDCAVQLEDPAGTATLSFKIRNGVDYVRYSIPAGLGRVYRSVLDHPVVNLPLGATLAAVACAIVDPVRKLLVDELAPLHWLWLGLNWVGAASAPLGIIQIALPRTAINNGSQTSGKLLNRGSSRVNLNVAPGACSSRGRNRLPQPLPAVAVPLEQSLEDLSLDSAKVLINVTYATSFGQEVRVVGGAAELGNWDVTKAPVMTWSDGHKWTLTAFLPPGTYPFKLVVAGHSAERWETGPNREVVIPPPSPELGSAALVHVDCVFDQTTSTLCTTKREEDEEIPWWIRDSLPSVRVTPRPVGGSSGSSGGGLTGSPPGSPLTWTRSRVMSPSFAASPAALAERRLRQEMAGSQSWDEDDGQERGDDSGNNGHPGSSRIRRKVHVVAPGSGFTGTAVTLSIATPSNATAAATAANASPLVHSLQQHAWKAAKATENTGTSSLQQGLGLKGSMMEPPQAASGPMVLDTRPEQLGPSSMMDQVLQLPSAGEIVASVPASAAPSRGSSSQRSVFTTAEELALEHGDSDDMASDDELEQLAELQEENKILSELAGIHSKMSALQARAIMLEHEAKQTLAGQQQHPTDDESCEGGEDASEAMRVGGVMGLALVSKVRRNHADGVTRNEDVAAVRKLVEAMQLRMQAALLQTEAAAKREALVFEQSSQRGKKRQEQQPAEGQPDAVEGGSGGAVQGLLWERRGWFAEGPVPVLEGVQLSVLESL